MKAEITKDRVLEAASKCPTAKETLKVLFPEFFMEDKSVQISKLPNKYNYFESLDNTWILAIRNSREFENKAFWLCDKFNWNIVEDSEGEYCLIPTKKQS